MPQQKSKLKQSVLQNRINIDNTPLVHNEPIVCEEILKILSREIIRDRSLPQNYVFQFVTIELDELVSSLIKEIKIPLILGLDQVASCIHKIKAVLIVKNIEMGAYELDKALNSVLDACFRESIPIVFSHSRRSMGKLILKTKHATVSCVGIPKDLSDDLPQNCILNDVVEIGWRNRIQWRLEFCQFRSNGYFNHRNENPLWIASYYGLRDPSIYSECVKNGISVDEVDCINGHTPLMVAALLNRLFLIRILLDLNVDLEIKSFSGENVLWMCAYNGYMEGWSCIVEYACRKYKKSWVQKLIYEKNSCGVLGWYRDTKVELFIQKYCKSNQL